MFLVDATLVGTMQGSTRQSGYNHRNHARVTWAGVCGGAWRARRYPKRSPGTKPALAGTKLVNELIHDNLRGISRRLFAGCCGVCMCRVIPGRTPKYHGEHVNLKGHV